MAEPKRDRWGRYILLDPDTGEERSWTRVTTLAETLSDSYGLTDWKLRNVVYGIGQRQELYELAAASDIEDKHQLSDIAEDAMKASGADSRSMIGTSLHKFTQRLDMGEPTRVTKRWEADVAAYEKAKLEWGIITAPSMCERITAIPELSVAGTMDRLVKYNQQPTVMDLKTGSSVDLGQLKIAIQLAIYSRGKVLLNEDTGRWEPMPRGVNQDTGIVVHLPAGEASPRLYYVDLRAGWHFAQIAYDVREGRKRKDLLYEVPGSSLNADS